jgi:hypothetical protein
MVGLESKLALPVVRHFDRLHSRPRYPLPSWQVAQLPCVALYAGVMAVSECRCYCQLGGCGPFLVCTQCSSACDSGAGGP